MHLLLVMLLLADHPSFCIGHTRQRQQFLRTTSADNSNVHGSGQGVLTPEFKRQPYLHCSSSAPNTPCNHKQEHEWSENGPLPQSAKPTPLESSRVLEVNIPQGPIRIETGKGSNILDVTHGNKKSLGFAGNKKSLGFAGNKESHVPLRVPLDREKMAAFQNEREAPCAAVSAKGLIKVIQLESFKMKIDASTGCGVESIVSIKKLGESIVSNLQGAGKWGDDTIKVVKELMESLEGARSNFHLAETNTYKALRCVKRCGECAKDLDRELGSKAAKLVDKTQKALVEAKNIIIENGERKKDALRILVESPKSGPLIEDAKKAAKLALVQIGLMLETAESVADGAWYSIADDGIKAGAAAAKKYLQTIGYAGDYMRNLKGERKQLNGWPRNIPRGGKCTQARLEMKSHSEELKKLQDAHAKRVANVEKTIDKLGDKKKEEEMKRGTIARARMHLKREEASKRPDTCITEHAANLTSIARSGCMHGCSARKRQREKYRSDSPNRPPENIDIRDATREERAKRRASLLKRLGVLKWLEGERMKDARTIGTLNNGTNTAEHNPLPYEDSKQDLPSLSFVEMAEFTTEMGDTSDPPLASTLSEKKKQKLRHEVEQELRKPQPNLMSLTRDKISPEDTKLNSPSKTSKSTRDILKMIIHNANLPFTYSDADAIPYELVKRDKLVLDQMIREGLVVDSGDRLLENKVERLDPSTILDTNVKCKEEYCPETLQQVLPGVTDKDDDGKTWIKACTLCCETIIPIEDRNADLNLDSTKNRLMRTKGIIPCNGECHARKAAKDLSYLRKIHSDKDLACQDLRKWSPCVAVCEKSKLTETGIEKSGCINGCREALLKGIPSVNDCAQYCDETVDQVFLEPEKYGYNIFNTRKMPRDALAAKNNWVKVCTDSCRAGFGLREEIFGKGLKDTDFCVHCPDHC